MKRAIIFGATDTGKKLFEDFNQTYEIICFVDENPDLIGGEYCGRLIKDYKMINQMEYDCIIIAVITRSLEVRKLLIDMGVAAEKINDDYVSLTHNARNQCLYEIRQILDEAGFPGNASIAELGVYQGAFSAVIGKVFFDNIFHLFDTFEGLPEKDVDQEGLDKVMVGRFGNTSIESVLSNIPNRERCIVHKGYFPDTVKEGKVKEEKFCFVNLDADLYHPTLEGLRFFYPRMVKGGFILIHDYFSLSFEGVKKAVQ